MSPLTIHTVGHSSRTFEEFARVLAAHGVRRLVDVRRHPGSRRHPQFDRAALGPALEREEIAYRHAEALGGMRDASPDSPHVALGDEAFRGYADHMASAAFAEALAGLVDWARGAATAVMCAERTPDECHRAFIADALVVRGVRVVHLLDASTALEHVRHPMAVWDSERLLYRGPQESLGL